MTRKIVAISSKLALSEECTDRALIYKNHHFNELIPSVVAVYIWNNLQRLAMPL